MAIEWDADAMARKLHVAALLENEVLVCWLDIPAETKKICKDVKRLLIEKLMPSRFITFKHGNYSLEKQHRCTVTVRKRVSFHIR